MVSLVPLPWDSRVPKTTTLIYSFSKLEPLRKSHTTSFWLCASRTLGREISLQAPLPGWLVVYSRI